MDIRTIMLVIAAVGVTLALTMVYLAATRQTYAGFRLWTWAMVMLALGGLLIGLRGLAPDLASFQLAHAAFVSFSALIWLGLRQFTGKRADFALAFAPLPLVVAALSYFLWFSPSVRMRLILSAVYLFIYFLPSFIESRRRLSAVLGGKDVLFGLGLGLMAGCSLVRIVVFALHEPRSEEFLSAGAFEAAAMVAYLVAVLTICLGIIKINAQRLENELRKTRQDLETIKSILPMCSNCKKVRDERNHWRDVETYLQAQSGAAVSHGLCPDCIRALYPDIAEKVLTKPKA